MKVWRSGKLTVQCDGCWKVLIPDLRPDVDDFQMRIADNSTGWTGHACSDKCAKKAILNQPRRACTCDDGEDRETVLRCPVHKPTQGYG